MDAGRGRSEQTREAFLNAVDELPLLGATAEGWSRIAAQRLDEFLADHAICEQQAALFGLNLVAHYPGDAELVDAMTALAAEEVTHLRRLTQLLHRRGLQAAARRTNPYVRALHERIARGSEPQLKCDRLLVGALIEARSCERFTRLLGEIATTDTEVADLLFELGPAERRHWKRFHALAERGVESDWFATRWRGWLAFEWELMADLGSSPRVHG